MNCYYNNTFEIHEFVMSLSHEKCKSYRDCVIDLDLRDDKQFFADHPGAVPISTAQVIVLFYILPCFF